MRVRRLGLIASHAIGQAAVVAVIPVLTRSYTPAELGPYQIAFSVGVVAQTIVTLRLESVIPAVDDSEAVRLERIGWFTVSLSAVLGAVLAGVVHLTGNAVAASGIVMTTMIALAYGVTALDSARLVRDKRIPRLAARNLLAGVLAAAAQAVIAILGAAVVWLAVAILAGRLLALVMTRDWTPRVSAGPAVVRSWDWRRGVLGTTSSLVAAAGLQVLAPLAGALLGAAPAALVGIAQRTASLPVSLLSQGMTQYAQAELASHVREGSRELSRALRKEILALAPVALLAAAALAVGGPLLAVPVFGAQWAAVGPLIAVLAIPAGVQLLLSPVSALYILVSAEKALLVVQVIRLVAAGGLTWAVAAASGSLLWATVAFGVGTCIGYVAIGLGLFVITKNADRKPAVTI